MSYFSFLLETFLLFVFSVHCNNFTHGDTQIFLWTYLLDLPNVKGAYSHPQGVASHGSIVVGTEIWYSGGLNLFNFEENNNWDVFDTGKGFVFLLI
jgi:hypothetical protein